MDLGTTGGQIFSNESLIDIAGTDEDELHFTERSGTNSDPTSFGYRISIPNGLYRIRLHFAEIFWGAPGGGPNGTGRRVFDVTLENELVLDDLDINAEVGPTAALVESFDVAITDEALDLESDSAFESYCVGAPNSVGSGASIEFFGNVSVLDNAFTLRTLGAPPSVSGLFLQGTNRVQTPLGSGFRCVGGSVFRLQPLIQTDVIGGAFRILDLTAPSQAAAQILPGSSWNFQLWYRDGSTANLTDGLGVTFTN